MNTQNQVSASVADVVSLSKAEMAYVINNAVAAALVDVNEKAKEVQDRIVAVEKQHEELKAENTAVKAENEDLKKKVEEAGEASKKAKRKAQYICAGVGVAALGVGLAAGIAVGVHLGKDGGEQPPPLPGMLRV